MSRDEWRRRLRQLRRCIDIAEAKAASENAARLLSGHPLWRANHIALYLANDGELDPVAIAQAAWQAGKHLYLPVITPAGMQFCAWHPGVPLTLNRYGIGEPQGEPAPAGALELLLLPTVGWSTSGFRLGMGGGYYDRFLAGKDCTAAIRLGLAYDWQQEDTLDRLKEPWDQPLNGIVTESGVRRFEGRAS